MSSFGPKASAVSLYPIFMSVPPVGLQIVSLGNCQQPATSTPGRTRREQLQQRLLGLALGGDVAEFLTLAEIGQRRRDRDAVLVAGDDARGDVGPAGHGGRVPQVLGHLPDDA